MSVHPTTPDRVAVETPQGNIRSGPVIGELVEAHAEGFSRVYRVDVDGVTLRVQEDDAALPR
jgi:hypothetical protein